MIHFVNGIIRYSFERFDNLIFFPQYAALIRYHSNEFLQWTV